VNGATVRLKARALSGTNGFHIFARNSQRPSTLKVSVLGTGGGGVTTLGELTDVSLVSPVDGDALVFNSGLWRNNPNKLSDAPADGQTYGRSNQAWAIIPAAPATINGGSY
jgi:hypothetical protein